ncbi:MAG: neutral zinc metallopeptidase [Phycisphaerae bacterium]|nr:neutral zinc metallopeptidase [Phycisphaerae bacterium]
MRWTGLRRSGNIEDRRRGGRGLALGGGGMLILILLAVLFGRDPAALMQLVSDGGAGPLPDEGGVAGVVATGDPEDDRLAEFVAVVLGDTETVWHDLFAQQGRSYREPKLVLFRDRVRSACGLAGSATGPFYCPGDEKVYLDLSFFADLGARFGAPGDFAQAYVIAHEIGHHVQKVLGISDRFDAQRRRVSEKEANALLVRLELQADFFAGVWAHHAHRARDLLEPGDLEEGLRAAAAVGDDRLQKQAQGYVVPDSFTHGTSEQRVRWFRRGYETGDISQGNTFEVATP